MTAGRMRTIKVMVVEDNDFLRTTLVEILERTPDIDVIAICRNGYEAISAVAKSDPDVILMDLLMADLDGAETTSLILDEFPGARILVLTSVPGHVGVQHALDAGALGVVVNEGDVGQLLLAIRSFPLC